MRIPSVPTNGRPPIPEHERKSVVISLRFTEAQEVLLRKRATAEGYPEGESLRKFVMASLMLGMAYCPTGSYDSVLRAHLAGGEEVAPKAAR